MLFLSAATRNRDGFVINIHSNDFLADRRLNLLLSKEIISRKCNRSKFCCCVRFVNYIFCLLARKIHVYPCKIDIVKTLCDQHKMYIWYFKYPISLSIAPGTSFPSVCETLYASIFIWCFVSLQSM